MTDHQDHCHELVADCRLRAATDLFAHTWDPVVLAALRPGPRRRRELRATIGGISDKVLTDTLKRLLSNGLIDRHAHAEAPPRVEYSLTGLGQSLVEGPMTALGRWAIEHSDELLEAQESALQRAQDRAVTPPESQRSERTPSGRPLRPPRKGWPAQGTA
ncbi:winged helix-turn-helix transcriptional regulator [Streptomyces abyssomicinicus]|uniref:winged helix-turn-helix transcriptional regulator n=1 Tax=Streptomyces abyssomicinicus TaxID=574929 RepID=UPI001250A8BC|nr:helix-turn-helix domain-containing protein [Streptomyces abyssomicinicus]